MSTESEASATVDVVVCGAGPAGSVAALVLARAGRRVLVIERAPHPRDKVCGDLLGTEAVRALERLGLDDATRDGYALRGAFVTTPGGRRYGAPVAGRRPAIVIERLRFDAALAAAARRAGATFVDARVTALRRDERGRVCGILTNEGPIEARMTIGADGWGSVVARDLGVAASAPASTAIAARAYAANVRDLDGAMHFAIGTPHGGYAWVFPLGAGRANVGLGFIRSELAAARRPAPAWADAFAELRDSPFGRAFLNGATFEDVRAWPIPLARRMRRGFAGAMLAGDAAGLASPLSGSGIANALLSGAAAARFALRALAGDARAERGYERWIAWHFGLRLAAEGAIHRTGATPARADLALAPLGRRTAPNSALARAMLALG